MPKPSSLSPPQGVREPPTPAEIRAWERWKHMDTTASRRARAAIVDALVHYDAQESQGQQQGHTGARACLSAPRPHHRPGSSPQTQHRTWQTPGSARLTAATSRYTADRTAPSLLPLTIETIALALSLAASAYLLAQIGQYVGLVYGVRAYQAMLGGAHGVPEDSIP